MGAAASVDDSNSHGCVHTSHGRIIADMSSEAHKCEVIRKPPAKNTHISLDVVRKRFDDSPRDEIDEDNECLSLSDQEMDDYLEDALRKQDLEISRLKKTQRSPVITTNEESSECKMKDSANTSGVEQSEFSIDDNVVNTLPLDTVIQGHGWYSAYAREYQQNNSNEREQGASPGKGLNTSAHSWLGITPKALTGNDTPLKPLPINNQKRQDQAQILNQLRQEGVVRTNLHQERQQKEKIQLQELIHMGIIPDSKSVDKSQMRQTLHEPGNDTRYKPQVLANKKTRLASIIGSKFNKDDDFGADDLIVSMDKDINGDPAKPKSSTNLITESLLKKSRSSKSGALSISEDGSVGQRQVAVITPTQRGNNEKSDFKLPCHPDDKHNKPITTPTAKTFDEKRMAEIEQLIVDLDIVV